MKKLNWLLFTFLTLLFIACKDDDDQVVVDTTPPTITVISPQEGQEYTLGESVMLEGRVEDNQGLQEVVITVTDPTGQVNTFNRGTGDFIQDGRVDEILFSITIPETAAPGTYTFTIDATDIQGNEATQASVSVVLAAAVDEDDDEDDDEAELEAITFTLTDIPENTPEEDDIYIAGEFAAGTWTEPGTDENFRLERQEDGTYTITLQPAETTEDEGVVQYKFFRRGWGTGEVTADCEGVPNRRLSPETEGTAVTDIQIPAWEDLCTVEEEVGEDEEEDE